MSINALNWYVGLAYRLESIYKAIRTYGNLLDQSIQVRHFVLLKFLTFAYVGTICKKWIELQGFSILPIDYAFTYDFAYKLPLVL
ncbi:MAG: hypothetical protein BGO78_04895 [Chloroflexi bacterium 44-23]|nr:MAG: hypothetical protein BGO78_04895 [Chloroflexi bacterium 44-23]